MEVISLYPSQANLYYLCIFSHGCRINLEKQVRFSAVSCAASQQQFAEVSEKVMDFAVLAHMANIMRSVKLQLRS